jgi:uncharacterized membrane protein
MAQPPLNPTPPPRGPNPAPSGPTPTGPIPPPKDESTKSKFTDKINNLRNSENIDELYNFARSNTLDTIALVVLFIGIILTTFSLFWGEVLVGFVAGYYFSLDVIDWGRHFQYFVEKEGVIRVLILGGLALALLIGAPGIFLGAAAAIGIKFIVDAIKK